MKVGEIVDLVLLSLGGGRISADDPVEPGDVLAYLPGAINEVVLAAKKEAETSARRVALSGRSVSTPNILNDIASVYDLPVVWDADSAYAVLPGSVIGGFQGVSSVSPKGNATFPFHKAQSPIELVGVESFLPTTTFYWLDTVNGEPRLVFFNIEHSVTTISLRAAVLLSSSLAMAMSAEAPIPIGYETAVVERCRTHFMAQAGIPSDKAVDKLPLNSNSGHEIRS